MDERQKIEQLKEWLAESRHTVFLGGAGMSTESGIPDFRSAHGLYMQKKQGISYEEMLSHDYFVRHTESFYDFLRHVMLYPDAKPNPAHRALVRLEEKGGLEAVITQNIDGLHQKAGSRNVIELHGSAERYYCQSCGERFTMRDILECRGVPRCTRCGGTVRPDIVLYGEMLDERALGRAEYYVERADLLLVGGTSLVVYPVAGLVNETSPGAKLVILNRDTTPYDDRADLILRGNLAEVLDAAAGG